MGLMKTVAASGEPVNRPLSYDFPEDPSAYFCTDQFMFGGKYMLAPITDPDVKARAVYFPKSERCGGGWKGLAGATSDAALHKGGETATVAVPLDEAALFECLP